jgi:hypothetical protein
LRLLLDAVECDGAFVQEAEVLECRGELGDVE